MDKPTSELDKEELLRRLTEAEETLEAIRKGDVDAIIVSTPEGERVYTLVSAETPYRIALDEMDEGVATLNEEGAILYANRRLQEMFSKTSEEMLGNHFYMFLREEEKGRFAYLLRFVRKTGVSKKETFSLGEEEKLFVRISINPLPPDTVGDLCVIVSDITELKKKEDMITWINHNLEQKVYERTEELMRTQKELEEALEIANNSRVALLKMIEEQKRAEAEIRRLNEELEERIRLRTAQLEETNRELEAFAYTVSHDLKAPIRTVKNFTKILREDYEGLLDEEGRRICDTIVERTDFMLRLIDDLLSLSRATKAEIHPVMVDMEEEARASFLQLTAKEERERIEFIVHPLPHVPCDPTMIKEVWTNLIGNAIKFSKKKENPVIEIRCEESEKEYIFSIKDNGVGFHMAFSDRLFNPFHRLHGAKEYPGTGVGLAIVRRIINRHGGRVWAEGEEGKGAIFYFSLPARPFLLETKSAP